MSRKTNTPLLLVTARGLVLCRPSTKPPPAATLGSQTGRNCRRPSTSHLGPRLLQAILRAGCSPSVFPGKAGRRSADVPMAGARSLSCLLQRLALEFPMRFHVFVAVRAHCCHVQPSALSRVVQPFITRVPQHIAEFERGRREMFALLTTPLVAEPCDVVPTLVTTAGTSAPGVVRGSRTKCTARRRN